MILFKTLIRRYHDLMKCLAHRPDPRDHESARALSQALEQLAAEAERLEAQIRALGEARQVRQETPPPLRLVWPPRNDRDDASG